MKRPTTPTYRTMSLYWAVFFSVLLGFTAIACSSTEQVQQQQEQTTTADSTAQTSTATQQNDEQRTKALKAKYVQQLREDYQAQANELTTFYILAQRRFYNGDFKNALYMVNKAIQVRENADLYALRGSIYMGLQDTEKFIENWRQALKMDEDVPMPLTDYVVEQLKNHGLVNENLEPNF